jgi:putative oxidoreductase
VDNSGSANAPVSLHYNKKTIMKNIINKLLSTPTGAQREIILLRLMAGGVFFWEGLLKFVYANQGVGRFTKLGFPFPAEMAHFIAVAEITGGLLLLFGLFTRPVAIFFIGEMIVAILSTKVSLYLGTSPLPLPPAPPQIGIWAVLHEVRSDYAQLFTCIFLALVGPGIASLDERLAKRRRLEPLEVK